MLRLRFAFVAAALVLASCAQSGSLPSAPNTNSTHRASAVSSTILPPQSPWRFWPTAIAPFTFEITQDTNHNPWFCSSETSLSQIKLSGSVTTYALSRPGCSNPVFTADGAIWFQSGIVNGAYTIARRSSSGSTSYFDTTAIPIGAMTAGYNNDVWFVAQRLANGFIGRLASDGTLTTYQEELNSTCFGPLNCRPAGITRGPDGNMYIWFDGLIQPVGSAVGSFVESLNPATGATTNANLKNVTSLGKMVVGPDERFWTIGTTDPYRTVPILVAIDTKFVATTYPLPDRPFAYGGIAAGRHALYLLSGNAILSVNTHGKITSTSPFPSQIQCCANAISAEGPGDDVWFATPNGIGVLKP